MGLDILKQTNITELPVSGDISGEDYIIVQGEEITTRVQFKDVYITKENTTFGQEINDLYEKIDKLTEIVDGIPASQDVYTKSETDVKLSSKLNTADSLTSAQLEDKYHPKTIIDAKVQSRAAKTEVYTKAEVDAKISGVSTTIDSLADRVDELYARIEKLERGG